MRTKELGDGYVRLSVSGGKIRDSRTGRTYRSVICKEGDVHYFEVAA